MTDWKIRRAPAIVEEITVPGDSSISQRAVLMAALSNGPCVIRGGGVSEECLLTVAAMRALGVHIEPGESSSLVVHGRKGRFEAPAGPIDCGNSPVTMGLLAGLLAGQPFSSLLVGDGRLSKISMRDIVEPLREMGAKIKAQGEESFPPLVIEPAKLEPIHYFSPVSSARVKGALLLAGMFADGKTTVTEPRLSRDHTERMLEYFLVRPQIDHKSVSIRGGQTPESRDVVEVPGDISSAAYWLVAAAAHPRSHLQIKNVGLNETRTGVLAVLLRMGAHVREVVESDKGDAEPSGTIEIRGARMKATTINASEGPKLLDELPVLAVAGALAKGKTIITGARELRFQESDRLAAIATNLRLMGSRVVETEDGMEITGGIPLKGTHIDSGGDATIAMAFAIAGLFAEGETTVTNVGCVGDKYPGFDKQLERIMKGIRQTQTPVISHLP